MMIDILEDDDMEDIDRMNQTDLNREMVKKISIAVSEANSNQFF